MEVNEQQVYEALGVEQPAQEQAASGGDPGCHPGGGGGRAHPRPKGCGAGAPRCGPEKPRRRHPHHQSGAVPGLQGGPAGPARPPAPGRPGHGGPGGFGAGPDSPAQPQHPLGGRFAHHAPGEGVLPAGEAGQLLCGRLQAGPLRPAHPTSSPSRQQPPPASRPRTWHAARATSSPPPSGAKGPPPCPPRRWTCSGPSTPRPVKRPFRPITTNIREENKCLYP